MGLLWAARIWYNDKHMQAIVVQSLLCTWESWSDNCACIAIECPCAPLLMAYSQSRYPDYTTMRSSFVGMSKLRMTDGGANCLRSIDCLYSMVNKRVVESTCMSNLIEGEF